MIHLKKTQKKITSIKGLDGGGEEGREEGGANLIEQRGGIVK